MSNIIHKVKDALSGHHNEHDTTTGTTHTTTTHGATHNTNPNQYSSGTSTNAGPHNSNIANKLDPTVDSDLDGSRRVGGNTNTGTYGSSNTYGSTGTGMTGTHSSNTGHGPHNSSMANKLDPTVDSTTGMQRNTGTTGNTGYSSTSHSTGTGLGGTGSGYNHSTNAGPHDSNFANKIDPRVDSDMDGSRTAGNTGNYGSSGTYGNTGMTSGTGAYSAHGHGGTTGGMTGSNNKTTAGPHNSDFANKIDPRVDSDLDGSRTIGNNNGPNRGTY